MTSYPLSNDYDFNIDTEAPFIFKSDFQGYMEMFNPPEVVSEYLNQHEQWFPDCAKPMTAESFGDNGYTLIIGRFGSFGYEVEPKMSVVFEMSPEQKYLMYSVDLPDNQKLGYTINYEACMELNPIPIEVSSAISDNYPENLRKSLPTEVTQVNWNLHLNVGVWFPNFIRRLPVSVIQGTGDRLLSQIVRQVSPRLTLKVQKNFHDRLNLPTPPKSSRYLEKINS